MKIKNAITFIILVGLIASPVSADKDKGKKKQLPPSLQMNVEKGKPLPPGWQKKLAKGEILDKTIYLQSQIVVPVDAQGLITVQIEGKLVKLYKDTREIVEILK